jgi:AraC-like DNA-binding protein/mannose-6-phosphate isomerase-like protein (cupin superfamily)
MSVMVASCELALQTLEKAINALESKRCRPIVPAPAGLMQVRPRMHFHFTPEVFLQIAGVSHFSFPEGELRLNPGELCVIPAGLPHGEVAIVKRQPFSNLVLMLTPATAEWHIAKANEDSIPVRGSYGAGAPADTKRLADYLSAVVEHSREAAPESRQVERGLMVAVLATFHRLMQQPASHADRPGHSPLVTRCRSDIMKRLSDPALNVQFLAARIPCSPNYLSHRFRQETGANLIAFIHQQRVAQACRLMETGTFTTKELAHAVGFLDPTYFIRIFRRLTGQTPGRYQARVAVKTASHPEPSAC